MRTLLPVIIMCGCTDLGPVIQAQRLEHRTAKAFEAVVVGVCEEGYAKAATQADIDRLDAIGCPGALRALTDVSDADAAIVALVDAFNAGQCVATIARDVPPKCDLLTALATLKDSTARLAAAVERLENR